MFDVKNGNTDDTGFMDDASTGSAQIFFLLCRKIWIVTMIHHPAKQENPVFIQF
jgi:hypothetical protein